MGLLGSLFSAAADIAKETITETMNQNETEKFIKIMMERDAQNAEANEKLYQDWLTHERSNYFAAKKNTIIHDAFDVLMDSFEDTGKFDFSAVDSLSDELKSSDSYKQEAADVVNLCCEALVKLHQKCCISIRSIKSSKSGSPQEVDTNLDEFLEYYPLICTSSWEDQLFILQKVFAYLKMYSQERKVLEFLVKNNIPRTEQIDRRLNFLKNLNQNDISNAANSIEEFSIQTSDNEIAYDYRFISWTVSEINSYMNLLTSEDKTLDLPMVVAEWNKKIPQKNIRWSTDAMQVYLDKYLHENFGDLYTTKIKNCGAVLSNEVEYEPSVYIEATDSAKYPWLSFVVTGEQLTMTQVSFAIYALYLPTKDSQCTQAVDTIEQNQKYQNRLITLKQAQNPKIKNYIESINEILISGLEAWLNNNNTSSMYD